MGISKCFLRLCNMVFASEAVKNSSFNKENSKDENDKPQKYNRSSSVPGLSSLSKSPGGRKKRHSNSIFGERATYCPLEDTDSLEEGRKRTKYSLMPTNRPYKYNDDPVGKHWPNKGSTTYYVNTGNDSTNKPSKYWVQTQLQYVILIPTEKSKNIEKQKGIYPTYSLHSTSHSNVLPTPTPSRIPPPLPFNQPPKQPTVPLTPLPKPPPSVPTPPPPKSTSQPPKPTLPPPKSTPPPPKPTPQPQKSTSPPPQPQKSTSPPPKPPKSTSPPPKPTPSPPKLNPPSKEKGPKGPRYFLPRTFSSLIFSMGSRSSSEDSDSFVPRSKAKRPSKPTGGRFCCTKRQSSGTVV